MGKFVNFLNQSHLKVVFLFVFTVLFPLQFSFAESAQSIILTEAQVREQMLQISKELGVSCSECHNVQNFKEDSMHSFKIAKEHIKLVQLLSNNGMNGRNGPEASCYMCHRGKMKYSFELKEGNEIKAQKSFSEEKSHKK